MKCLVTGGAGFIGSNLALELEKEGHGITVTDNFLTGKKENLKGFKGKIIELDVSEPYDFQDNFDAIFHQAAITDPRHPDDNETYSKNIKGFRLMIDLAKKCNAKLIYASTANLYGNGPVPMKEDQEKDIFCAYGKSKLEMDNMAKELFSDMHIIGLRYFNVFGPREAYKKRAASMIYHLGNQIRAGKNPRIFRMGEQIRDHIYVKDCVTANLKALYAPSGVYNVGTGIGTSFNELIKILNEILNTNFESEYFDMPYDPKTYQANTQADTAKAEKLLKFKAEWSLKEGIKDYFRWLGWI